MTNQATFDPHRSQVSHDHLISWLRSPITGNPEEVPGIGPKNGALLQEKKEGVPVIETTHQLIGSYLALKGKDVDSKAHNQAFYDMLQSRAVDSHRSGIVDSIASKVNTWVPGTYDHSSYAVASAPAPENKAASPGGPVADAPFSSPVGVEEAAAASSSTN